MIRTVRETGEYDD